MNQRRTLIIAASIVIILVVSVVTFAIWQTNRQSSNNAASYQSLEEINKPKDEDTISFLNISSLINQGATSHQIVNTKKAFKAFKPEAEEVVLFSTTIKTQYNSKDPNSIPTATFTVTIDNVTYDVKLQYLNTVSLSSIHLHLFDLNGNQVFDSGVISNPNST